jgi:hypothetical protein
MYKTLCFGLLAAVVAFGANAVIAKATPQADGVPVAGEVSAVLDLKAATGATQYSAAYCSRLADRCSHGDNNACALYAKGCGL